VKGADLVLLRNVLIYFDVETKRRILGKVRHVLHPDGYLLLGAAETTFMLDDGFERAGGSSGGCYRLRADAATS
jgi:chemotaxis protein methyltransferase CheR